MAQPAPENHKLYEVSTQLDQLLARISKRSTASVQLQDVVALLKNHKVLKKSVTFKQLCETAVSAEHHLNLLQSVKGVEIKAAFNPDTGVWTGAVGARITAAREALGALSEQLLTLVNNPAVRADEKLYAAIEEKYLKSCCRESEFDTVLMSMIDINDDVESPKLHQTIGEWMVKLAPSMHGTGELLKLQSHPSFVALQTLLKELGGNDQAAISAETRENLVSAAKNLQAHMRQLERSERSADKAFFREAEAVFKQIIGALENPRKAAIDSVLSRHIKACFNLPPALDFSDELLKELASSRKLNCPLLAKFISLCRSVDQLAKAYVERRIARIRPVLQQR